jgi:hypothetical protein
VTQMPFAEYDHMIKAIASDRADQSFWRGSFRGPAAEPRGVVEACRDVPETSSARRWKASAMLAQNRLRPDNRHCIENRRNEPVQPYTDGAIKRAEGGAPASGPTQHVQLLTKDDYLRLDGNSGAEQVEEHPLDQIEELEHSIFIVRFFQKGKPNVSSAS